MEVLNDKVLVMLIGPSAIGKSSLMNQVAADDDNFGYVRSFTTRPPRPGEKTNYEFIDRSTAQQLIDNQLTATQFQHPTTGHIYGTTAASYTHRFNLLDTLSGSVAIYRQLPFETTVTITITAPPQQWRQWFLARFPEPSREAQQRLAEATQSIRWSLQDEPTYWLVNHAGQLAKSAANLIDTVKTSRPATEPPNEAHGILNLIERGEIWPNQ